MTKKQTRLLITIIVVSILLMYIVDFYIQPGYLPKTIIKMILFLVIPTFYSNKIGGIAIKQLFKINSSKEIIISLLLAIGIYVMIIGAYFILRGFIDLNNIQGVLDATTNVSKNNFIYIAIYISFMNSLLEEFFFRGFLFLNLNKSMNHIKSYSISAFTFSIYHVAILANWFNPILFIVSMVGLFIGGLIFNWLNETNENIYSFWLVHMFANFAINTVGLLMYGII